MHTINEKKLLLLIRYIPVIIIGIVSIIISILTIVDNHDKAAHSVDELRYEIIERHKVMIQQEVMHISHEARYQDTQTKFELKKQAKNRVEEAYQIALNIYNHNQGKPESEVTALINNALRPIRFFSGRGYFFIFKMNGINVMHALRPDIENQSQWDSQDSRGTYILRDHIALIEKNGEAYYQWWYIKPGEQQDIEFEKIGYGKKFLYYDWFIGTGEYVQDVESDLKSEILKRVNSYRNEQQSNIFIVDDNNVLLLHNNSSLIGKSISELKDKGDIWSVMHDLEGDSDFYEYKPVNSEKNGMIYYIEKVDEWGWTIGAGFNLSNLERYIRYKQIELQQDNNKKSFQIGMLSLIVTLAVMATSLMLSIQVSKRFFRFQERINAYIIELLNTRDSMQHMALHDELTGLPNRSLLIEYIESSMKHAHRSNKQLAVAFLDLDNFKLINDLRGHSVGDKVLKEVAYRFNQVLTDDDFVARFGGDEFVFCFSSLNSLKEAEYKIKLIKDIFNTSFDIPYHSLLIDCSIGVSIYPDDGEEVETLIRKADIVLHRAKDFNKGAVIFYDQVINDQVQKTFQLQEQLSSSLVKNEVTVLYQPQVDFDSLQIVGVEALVRWNNDKMGFVPTDVFIELAEESGFIHDIGLFVFTKACNDFIELSKICSLDNVTLSVNISPKQLMSVNFADELIGIVNKIAIDVSQITLEITENVFISDFDKVVPIFQKLRKEGFGLSLDDFGTGYSSLSYLNTLPITEIKIDRCFIDKMLTNPQSMSLVKAVIAISEASQVKVISEGVETIEQFQSLKDDGCCIAQGYLFDRPLTFEALTKRCKESGCKYQLI
ncbi:hypothetical protein BCU68_12320 [Vibrio sp. 10N.286.49.B3]|uniref:bifunctional diguanylate cyclase/phosphodiesterase n=1 Tax=Vibrio sp. 10N.286.49.B3 TaxID=1880855 RepID=UPI000C83742A|nr:cache domain-containing protein [Vibrio sp. 10N.286.49.B3]PMH44629.1 hypothetical protein BCU68_12320 [Vibrio sp. 10N.286.49.B3]